MVAYFSELNDKTVIVTGGSKGLGKDIALKFAELGAHVIITGRQQSALDDTLQQLQALNDKKHRAYSVDINDLPAMHQLVQEVIDENGQIDVLVNNAGVNLPKPAFEVTEEDWDTMLDTNVKALFFLTQAVGQHFIDKGIKGKIINIASQLAFVGYVKRAPYSASKGAVVQLTKALAVEWAQYGINVNAVAPTYVETELTAKSLADEAFKKDVLSRILLGAIPEPKDIAGAVLYLASDLANFVTGETIKVDGGWTAM